MYDVEIPNDAEVVEIDSKNAPHGIFRANKIIICNPRPVTEEVVIDLYRKSNLPEKTYYQCLVTLLYKNHKEAVKYIIRDNSGKLITDYFDAEKRIDVESFLISQGFEIVEIVEDKWAKQLGLGNVRTKKMSFKELSFFLTQLSTYIKAGIPLTESIIILGKQAKKKGDKNDNNRKWLLYSLS